MAIRDCASCPSLYVHEGKPEERWEIVLQPGRSYCAFQKPAFQVDRRKKGIPECCGRRTAPPTFRVYIPKKYIPYDCKHNDFPAMFWRVYEGPLVEEVSEGQTRDGRLRFPKPIVDDCSLIHSNGAQVHSLSPGDTILREDSFLNTTTFSCNEHCNLYSHSFNFAEEGIEWLPKVEHPILGLGDTMLLSDNGKLWVWEETGHPAFVGLDSFELALPSSLRKLARQENKVDGMAVAVEMALFANELIACEEIRPKGQVELVEKVANCARVFTNGYVYDGRHQERLKEFAGRVLRLEFPPKEEWE